MGILEKTTITKSLKIRVDKLISIKMELSEYDNPDYVVIEWVGDLDEQ